MKYLTTVTNLKSLFGFMRQELDINACDEDGETLLTSLIARNELILAETLILNGADINAKNSAGKTALQIAADQNNSLAINKIIHTHLQKNRNNNTASTLSLLYQINSDERIWSVLSPETTNLLHIRDNNLASYAQEYDIPEIKLRLATEIFDTFYGKYQPSQQELNQSLLQMVDKKIIYRVENEPRLAEAISSDDSRPDAVRHSQILETEGVKYSHPRKLWGTACREENSAILKTELANLLEKGADLSFSNRDGENALMLAAKGSCVEFFDLISPQDSQSREGVLHNHDENLSPHLLQKVGGTNLRKKIDINQKDRSGKSALIHAVSVHTP